MIATEGPNILGKLNMSGVEVPYYSQFTTRMVLNPSATKQPLLYGFLGTEVTFILLKFTYDETNPLCNIEEEQYIEYYFADQPSVIRYASKLLLLTGNSVNRIPQIYLNNPGEIKVYVDAMVANLEQPDINLENVNNVTISNLYYNNVISDIVLYTNATGSTQLQIVGIDGYIQLYLDYIDILTIEPQYETNELKITTISDTTIILGFLSSFEMYQALSRISWVMKDSDTRYLTKDYPSVDIIPPQILLNPLIPVQPNTYSYPYTSGTTVLPSDIISYFISGITDNRDGDISIDSVYITIRQTGHVETLTGITYVGIYDIVMGVNDIANNASILNYTIICDDVPPIIYFKPIATGSGFTMTTTDMSSPSLGITATDIIIKSVDFVYDVVDGIIPNSNITILVNDSISGITGLTLITTPGSYDLIFTVEDYSKNIFLTGKTMTYVGNKILNSNETFTLPAGMSSMNFEYIGGTGTTATIIISGKSFSVTDISGITSGITTGVTEIFIFDSIGTDSGGTYYHNFGTGSTDSFTFIVSGNSYTISFTGRASLLFTLLNNGPISDHFNISPTGLTYDFATGSTNTFDIITNCSWTISDNLSWLSPNITEGSGDTTITCTTTSLNDTGYSRSGLTIVTPNSILPPINVTEIQESEFYFSLSVSALTFSSGSSETKTFDIITNTNWTIYDSVSWLDFDTTYGSGSLTITATTNEENVDTDKYDKIFVISNIGTFHDVLDMTVTQLGANYL
jgi:hypothetical protein